MGLLRGDAVPSRSSVEQLHDIRFGLFYDVDVCVVGHSDRRVPEKLADLLDLRASFKKPCGKCVAEGMEGRALDFAMTGDIAVLLFERAHNHASAGLCREHKRTIASLSLEPHDGIERGIVERNMPTALGFLRRFLDDLMDSTLFGTICIPVVDHDGGFVDKHAPVLKVYIAPIQRYKLSEPHSCIQVKDKGIAIAVNVPICCCRFSVYLCEERSFLVIGEIPSFVRVLALRIELHLGYHRDRSHRRFVHIMPRLGKGKSGVERIIDFFDGRERQSLIFVLGNHSLTHISGDFAKLIVLELWFDIEAQRFVQPIVA